jgi:hypothetical protein
VTGATRWREVESEVYSPLRWVGLIALSAFFLIGVIGFVTIGQTAPAGRERWIARVVMGGFALLGGMALPSAVRRVFWPARVRHAAPDVLPDVPPEPVLFEGAVVRGRLTHEIVEDSDGWQLRPSSQVQRDDQRFLIGFGVPFLILGAGVSSWIFGAQFNLRGWVPAILSGTFVTLACGGTVLYLIGMMMRAGHRRLSSFRVARNGNDVELDLVESLDPQKIDLSAGLRWVFVGDTARRRLAIPRELLKAVQLCPWKVATRGEIAWAAEGLLVVANPSTEKYVRFPLLLSSDFAGSARLMQQLAAVLHVPYLFCADAAGVEAERIRAQNRPPLQCGGTMT